jgi:soluble lytic murein transglycosylase-like protein
MFTPVKIGVVAAAALAAAVPTSLALVDRSDRPAGTTEASFKPVRTEPIAVAVAKPADAPLAQPAGASIVAPDLATGDATVRSVPIDALEAKQRLDAGFDQLATAPALKPGAKLPLLPPDPLPQGVLPPVAVGTPYAVPVPAPEPELDQRLGAVTTLAAAAPSFAMPKTVRVETVRIPQQKPVEQKDAANDQPGADKVVVAVADPEAKPAASADALKNKYRDMVEAEAKKQGLPPKFALAFVEVASNWNAKKRGDDTMTGLTQIRLRTAKQFGYKGDQDELWDPETNIRWGLRYLSGAYKKVDGDQCKALMKWQGGYLADSMTKPVQQLCGQVRQAMAVQD